MVELRNQPCIFIPVMDYDRLLAIAEGNASRESGIANFLMQELERASTKMPRSEEGIVKMQSHIRFRDDLAGTIREVQLVYPDQIDSAAGRISILTPVGAALIGLSEGQSMRWRDRNGKRKSLTVLDVWNVPETSA